MAVIAPFGGVGGYCNIRDDQGSSLLRHFSHLAEDENVLAEVAVGEGLVGEVQAGKLLQGVAS